MEEFRFTVYSYVCVTDVANGTKDCTGFVNMKEQSSCEKKVKSVCWTENVQ